MSRNGTRRRRLGGWVLALSVAILLSAARTSSGDPVPEDFIHDLMITFDSGSLAGRPLLEGDQIQADFGLGKQAVTPLPSVSYMANVIPVGAIGYMDAGPWYVRVASAASTEDLIAEFLAHPEVVRCVEAGLVEDNLIGEASRSWFPAEAYTSDNCALCQTQPFLHFPNPDELPEPTLLDAGTDACAWYVDGIGTPPIEEWPPNVQPPTYFRLDSDFPQAWAITQGSEDVAIAIIDTGVQWEHPDLGGTGPPPGSPFEDLLEGFRDGVVFHNDREEIGDANEDGQPGVAGEDDDGDGVADEDFWGLTNTNVPESDLMVGTVTAVGVYTISDDTATWANLADWWVIINSESGWPRLRIESSTATQITLAADPGTILADPAIIGVGGAAFFTQPGSGYFISDGMDSDLDGFVDDGWSGTHPFRALDDDENGYPDDLKGWFVDFPSSIPYYHTYPDPPDIPGSNDSRGSNVFAEGVHGTWVTGVAAAVANGQGIAGAAPGVKILPIRTFGNEDLLAAGVHYARSLRDAAGNQFVKVINISRGLVDPEDLPEAWLCENFYARDSGQVLINPFARALEEAIEDGIIVVAGTGNTSTEVSEPYWMHCNPDIVSVAGVRANHRPWLDQPTEDGTTYGPWVDIAANANQMTVATTCNLGCSSEYGLDDSGVFGWAHRKWGTSFAGPIVAGVAALMRSAYPDLPADELRQRLYGAVDPIDYTGYTTLQGKMGSGVVNAYKALTWFGDITVPGVPLVWKDDVWVSGDIVVPAGATLTIEAGTVVHVAQDDILNAETQDPPPAMDPAVDPEMLEFIIDGTLVVNGTSTNPVIFEIFAQDGPTGPPHNPDRQWGHLKFAASENLVGSHVEFHDLLPRDVASVANALGTTLGDGGTLDITWTQDHVQSTDATPIVFEDLVRVRTSIDGGVSFDAGATYPISTGAATWTANSSHFNQDLVLRVEFVDTRGRVIGWDDFADYHVTGPFANASGSSGITIPEGSTPYASVPVDYDEDGHEDLVVSYTDRAAQLYRNDGVVIGDMATFTNRALPDLASGTVGNTKGVVFADADNNGTIDLLFASENSTQLYSSDTATPGDLTADWSSVLGVTGSAASSAAAFGDANGDGLLDLYLVRDTFDVLLQASISGGLSYTDVTAAAGLRSETAQTSAAMFADIDRDGDQDLFVCWAGTVDPGAGAEPDWSFYYLNTGLQSGQVVFQDVTDAASGPAIPPLGNVHAVDFADLDGDTELDIVLARQLASPSDGLPNLIVLLNDGNGGLTGVPGSEFGITDLDEIADVEITDLDGNGLPDVLALPADGSTPLVRLGYDVDGQRRHFDGTAATALGAGSSYGLQIADFNGDTDPDVFLLRPEVGASKDFLYANPRLVAPPASGEEEYLTVRLGTMTSGINRLGIGTRVGVTVQTPTGKNLSSTQVVDGGSGHGSQGSSRLVFGLGGASTAQLKVRWPNGTSQLYLDAASLPDFPNVVLDYTVDPEIDPASITATYMPGSNVVHKITWWTEHEGGAPQVLLTIANPATGNCKAILDGGTSKLLKAGVPGVTVSSVEIDGRRKHTVNYATSCFAVCNYNFTVRNNVNGAIYSAAGGMIHVNVCGQFGE